ncbi:hypothetical protein DLM77_07105 [Leptospira yasudae]|uniref:Uncharacterized protein n=1 Tax=Leptospira yasudae TaxID=2202201 RepID=A0ABX9M4K6_9LEPT|nr:hypothetical protein DLM77_07105 [Leptospira yasudae]
MGLSQTGPFLIFKTGTERKQTETQTIPITDASMQTGFPEQNDRNSYGSSSWFRFFASLNGEFREAEIPTILCDL